MKTEEGKNYTIIAKYDHELSKREINEVFLVYNECFYENKLVRQESIKLAKECLAKKNIFQWYMVVVENKGIVGIANYVYDHTNTDQLSIRTEKGENVTSIGVAAKHRGHGYARLLLERILEDHAQEDLVVEVQKADPKHDGLVQFYEAFGFVKESPKADDGDNVYLRRKAVQTVQETEAESAE